MPAISASLRSAGSIVGRGRVRSPRAANAAASGGGGGATVPAIVSAFAQSGSGNNIGVGPIVISWTAPANGGAAITSYTLTYYWIDGDTGEVNATLYTTTQAGTSFTIAESTNHAYSPNTSGLGGAQPRWVYGGYLFRITVAATNSVGTGTAGSYDFYTGGG